MLGFHGNQSIHPKHSPAKDVYDNGWIEFDNKLSLREEEDIIVENYIDGKFVQTNSYINSEDPSVGRTWAKIPDSNENEVMKAVMAAKRAFPSWSSSAPSYRSKILMNLADLIEQNLDEFARAESRDQGKPITLARNMDIPRAVLNLRSFATAALHQVNESREHAETGTLGYVTRHAAGVAGLISPWNLPLYLLTFKLAPALASGCTVVAKPSEMTSVTAWMMTKMFDKAGMPAGVVNMVYGSGPKVGNALVKHPDVPLISFTGSTPTAKCIQSASVGLNKKLSLELGGKNAALVFEDADFDECVRGTLRSSFTNQGEVCLCTSRIFVQKTIYNVFVKKFVELARKMKIGSPSEPTTQIGALVSQDHFNKVKSFVELARTEGATIQCGYGVDTVDLPESCSKGYFMRPTVITDIPDISSVMQDEIFGPVTCIVPFDTADEVVVRANNVKYGLCASIWSTNLTQTLNVAKQLEVGIVWVNSWCLRDLAMPFGGVKASGSGREGTAGDSLDFFTEKKTVCLKM